MRPLTQDEIDACASSPQFANVRGVDVFGARSSGELAARIAAANRVRYRELREEYELEAGLKPRPNSYYG